MKTAFLICTLVLVLAPASYAWNTCPPEDRPSNPKPVAVGKGSACIVSADGVSLNLNEAWSRTVQLKGGQNYWFSASKCARGRSLAGEIRDNQGTLVGSDSGSSIGFCFKAPKTGSYTARYSVTGLNSSYSYAVTDACLEESNCTP